LVERVFKFEDLMKMIRDMERDENEIGLKIHFK
jgi:hypothetical protein